MRQDSSNTGTDTGTVFLVGAGPGDVGLITVRGKQLIDSADVIVYDALANTALLPQDAKETGRPELYYVGKRGGDNRSVSQEEINSLVVKLARQGKRVVRLKGGDPLVFGRGSEEAQALNEAQVPFEIVPGITAGIAAATYAGIPVTHRGLATSVTFVTGHEEPGKPDSQTDWHALAKVAQKGGTIVLYMGVKTLSSIVAALKEGGLQPEVPAAAIQWGTHSKQRTVTATLDTLVDQMQKDALVAPVITVIGWPVVLREELAWFENRPLFGKRIVVTRASQQASTLSDKLREQGADVIEMPATRIARLDLTPLREAIENLAEYQWIIFTSQNGVSLFWEQLLTTGHDARALSNIKICAIGPSTAGALLDIGIAVDVVPERFVAEGLLEKLAARIDVTGSNILYVAADGARDVLPHGLAKLGASVTMLQVYRSIADGAGAEKLRKALESGQIDLVTFTSASSVQGYVEAVGEDASKLAPAASIGPITTEAASNAGIEVVREAAESTISGLVEAILRGK